MDVGDPGGPARWPRPVVRPGASPVGPARWSNRDVRPLALGACPSGPLRPCASGPLALCASALRRYDRPRSSPRWFPAPLRLAVAAPPGVGWACPPGLAVAAPPGVGWACPPGLGVCCPARGRLGLSSRSRGLLPRPGSVGPVLPVSGFAAVSVPSPFPGACPTPSPPLGIFAGAYRLVRRVASVSPGVPCLPCYRASRGPHTAAPAQGTASDAPPVRSATGKRGSRRTCSRTPRSRASRVGAGGGSRGSRPAGVPDASSGGVGIPAMRTSAGRHGRTRHAC